MISIITPILNGKDFIEKNILSVMKLSIPHEHIVVDGGSNDGSLDIIASYPSVKLIHQKDKHGMYSAIHQGFIESKFDYITWINCDDEIIPDTFAKAVKTAEKRNVDFLFGGVLYKNSFSSSYLFRPPIFFSRYFLINGIMSVAQSSTLYKRSTYFESGGLNYKSFKLIGDLDLFQRFATNTSVRFYSFPKAISVFYLHQDSLLARSKKLYKIEESQILHQPNKIMIFIFRVFLFRYYINKLVSKLY